MKKRHLISAAILAGIMAACGQKQATTRQESNKDLERMENVSIHVTEDCIQVYENSNCRTTTATIDEVDYMVGYSDPLHSIDLIALNGTPNFQQIKLCHQLL